MTPEQFSKIYVLLDSIGFVLTAGMTAIVGLLFVILYEMKRK